MSSIPPPDASRPAVVLVTGVCGRLGKRVARVLHREMPVLGVDRRPFADRPADVEHYELDLRRKKLKDVFRANRVRAVVHLGVMHDPRISSAEHHAWNIGGLVKLLDYVAQFKVPKLVVLSSANVYGPQPENPQFLGEESPLLAAARFSEMRDLVAVDNMAQSFFWRHPATETVILRPAHILGTVRNAASNFLRLDPVPTLMGFDPMVQLVHERDVAQAIRLALEPGKRGIYNLAGPDPLPLSRAISMLGKRRVPIPYTLGKFALKRMFSLRLSSFPEPELDHIRYVCMVDDRRARRELGYAPSMDLLSTLRAIHDESFD